MSSLVSTIGTDALTYIGVLAAGETTNTDDQALLLRMINRLVDSWSAEKIALLGLTSDSITLTGAASYAVTTTHRPLKIRSAATVAANGTVMPARVRTAEEFDALPDKTRTGIFIEDLFYDAGYASANIYVTPKPAAGTLQLRGYYAIALFSAWGDTVDFPAGIERALTENLAVMAAGIWGRPLDQTLAAMAAESKGIVKQLSMDVLGPHGLAPVTSATEPVTVPQAPAA